MLKEGKRGNKYEGHNELDLSKILEFWTVLMGFYEHSKTSLYFKKEGHYSAPLLADKWDK